MIKTPGKAHYIIVFSVILVLFILESRLNEAQVKWLLTFYKNAAELYFGNYHYYSTWGSPGYYASGGNYFIGMECAGLNNILLLFTGITLTPFIHFKRNRFASRWGIRRTFFWMLFSGLTAVLVGITANVLRLLSSIYFTAFAEFKLIHLLFGIVLNLTALIFCYWFARKILFEKGEQ